MKKKLPDKDIVYKDQLFHLLMLLLEHARWQTRDEDSTYKAMAKWLKFQHPTDWQRYQSSVHLLGDTELAIQSAFEYQLGDLRNPNRDHGGLHLRLYGALNAVYLQMSAYETIMNLFNYPKRQHAIKVFQQLDIYKLRGIAGAHTVNYIYNEETLKTRTDIHKTTSFSILQHCLEETGKRIEAIDKNGLTFNFNLLEVLTEYEKMATDLLVQLIYHSIRTFYKAKEDKVEMKNRLNELLPNLMDYTQMNRNKEHRIRQEKKWKDYLKSKK